jgi:EmrB/QacA subfamily drug resistance transporter
MIILDTTVVNVAFQAIREEFGGDISHSQWVISIYVLALGISTPLSGFLADRFGGKKIYLGGLGLFALGSLACGLSPNLNFLIVARAVQGIGGGLAMPLGTALLLQAFPPKEQGMALGLFGIAALVAPALGPILGGWLVDQNIWRVIFFINPPIGLIGVLLGMRFLREKARPVRPLLDIGGILTEIIGFGAILYAASIAADNGWSAPVTLAWFAVGAIGLILFVVIELFIAKEPLLDLRLFGNLTFLSASILGYITTVALFGAEFLMPIYLQALRGRTALQTGLVLLPMALAGGIFVTISGRIYDRIGPRPLMISGFLLLMVNTWQLAQIQPNTSITWITLLLVLRGLALGLTVQTAFVAALSVVPYAELARGSSLTNATRLVVQSIGVAVLATILASAISPEVRKLQTTSTSNPAPVSPGRSVGPGSVAQSYKPDTGNKEAPNAAAISVVGLCEITSISQDIPIRRAVGSAILAANISNTPQPQTGTNPHTAGPSSTLRARACAENITGFERAYRFTFFASALALIFGLLLPGWPGKWTGRGQETPLTTAH